MTDTKYSEFTLNFNPRFRRKSDDGADDKSKSDMKPATLVDKAKVIDSDGTETEFEVAAWGPNAAKTRGPDYYSGSLNPKDPGWRARQLNTMIDGPVRNAIHRSGEPHPEEQGRLHPGLQRPGRRRWKSAHRRRAHADTEPERPGSAHGPP